MSQTKPEVVCSLCQKETEASIARRESPFCTVLQVQRVKLEWWGHLYDPSGPWKGNTFDLCDVCFERIVTSLRESGIKIKDWPVRKG